MDFGYLDILGITGPIFVIIGIGFLAARLGWFPKENVRALGIFVIRFALPAMIFKAIAEKHISEIFNLEYVLAYALGSLLAFFIALFISFKRGQDLTQGTITALGSSFSNSGFIGYPIVIAYLGSEAMVGVALTIVIENTLLLPLIMGIAESGTSTHPKISSNVLHSLKSLFRNPLVIAVTLGIAVSLLEIKTPEIPNKVISMLAAASSSVSLFAIGGVLVGLELKGKIKEISLITFSKLIMHPLMVLLLIFLLPSFDRKLQLTAIILASMPMMSIYPIIGQKYGLEETCAASLLLTTICSFATISGLIWVLHFS